MRIKSVETINFRNLKNNYPYRFDSPYFTTILGPNEAGKTSILEAIEMGLFTKVDKHKEPDFMTWGKTEKPVIKLMIEKDGKDMFIERNFQDGKSYMRGEGIDLKDEKQIEEILGFNDPDTFRNLLTIKQNEMVNLDSNSIQEEMDILVTGGMEGNSVTEILKLLESKLSVNRNRFKGGDGKIYEKLQSDLDELNTRKN
jgi:DNA repair exonuclease SbcCD ATPase subunit